MTIAAADLKTNFFHLTAARSQVNPGSRDLIAFPYSG
jgi:hypothetical protein